MYLSYRFKTASLRDIIIKTSSALLISTLGSVMFKDFIQAFLDKLEQVRDERNFNFFELKLEYVVDYFQKKATNQEVINIKPLLKDYLFVLRENAEEKSLFNDTYEKFFAYLKYELIYEELIKILSIQTGYISWFNQTTNSASEEKEKYDALASKMKPYLGSKYQSFKSLERNIMYIEHFKASKNPEFEVVYGKDLTDIYTQLSAIDIEIFTTFDKQDQDELARRQKESLEFIEKNTEFSKLNKEESYESLSSVLGNK